MNKEIIVCGDFHSNFHIVNQFLCKKPGITMILQCGDFGWWPRFHNKSYLSYLGERFVYDQFNLKNKHTKIFWCPGNHEDWEDLMQYKGPTEVMPNVFYMPRNSVMDLPDGRKVLFMGGGLSIDRKDRDIRSGAFGWFVEETISQKDIEELPDEKIDIVISHTAPNEFILKDYHLDYYHDPSRDALSAVLDKYHPKLWYFGHMHYFQTGITDGCKWTCLSDVGGSYRWWIQLRKADREVKVPVC